MTTRLRLLMQLIPAVFISGTSIEAALVPCKNEKGKWGLVDETGSFIVKPKFMEINETPYGEFLVAEGGSIKDGILDGEKWGVYSADGREILTPQYDEIGEYDNGATRLLKGDKTGYADKAWNVVIPPKFNYAGSPSKQGFIWVNIGGKPDKQKPTEISGGNYGIYHISGKEILKPVYKSIGYVVDERFHYDDARIYDAETPFARLTLEAGNHPVYWPKEIQRQDGFRLPDGILGFGIAEKPTLMMNGISDPEGKILVKPGEFQKVAMPSDGFALVRTKKNIPGYYEVNASRLTELPDVKTAFSFKNGVSVVIDKKNQWKFINTSLKPVGETFTWISPQFNGYYIVRNASGMKLVTVKDRSDITDYKDYIYPESQGYMVYKSKEGKWGILNADASVAIAPEFDYLYSFRHGNACAKYSTGWSMIDLSLKKRIPGNWTNIKFPIEDNFNYVWVQSENGKWTALMYSNGTMMFDKGFEDVCNFKKYNKSQYALVKEGAKFGVIRPDGSTAIPVEMNSWDEARRSLTYMISKNIHNWKPIDSYRFRIYNSNARNKGTLSSILKDGVWDY